MSGDERMTLDEMRAEAAWWARECERSRLVGEMAWCRLWVRFVHGHRDLWSIPAGDRWWWSSEGGWESHGDHLAFLGALQRLHHLRQRLWVLTEPAERGPRPALTWHEQVRRHGGFGDPR